MLSFKKILDFYINSSLHVAFSALALTAMTVRFYGIPQALNCLLFVFCSTLVGYNFVKYEALVRTKQNTWRIELKFIMVLSFMMSLVALYLFFQFQFRIQLFIAPPFLLTLLYTLPFFPNRANARNWKGVKIYMVSFCWVLMTVFFPIIFGRITLDGSVFWLAIQRFILIFVLVLIFEIIDVTKDDPHLQTVPQMIGVDKTKKLGYLLLSILVLIDVFQPQIHWIALSFKLLVSVTIVLFLYFAKATKSRYYSSFWAEGIPIFWWLIILIFI